MMGTLCITKLHFHLLSLPHPQHKHITCYRIRTLLTVLKQDKAILKPLYALLKALNMPRRALSQVTVLVNHMSVQPG